MSRSLRTSNLSFRMTRKFVWFFSRFKEERELTGEDCRTHKRHISCITTQMFSTKYMYRCFLNGSAIAVQCRNSSSHGIHKEELKFEERGCEVRRSVLQFSHLLIIKQQFISFKVLNCCFKHIKDRISHKTFFGLQLAMKPSYLKAISWKVHVGKKCHF